MDTQRWQELNHILDHVWDMAESECQQYLQDHCDSEMRREVEAVLKKGEEATSAMELSPNLFCPQIPTFVGPYRIIREIGAGGMGCVYMGVRDNGDFQQQVAIKLIRNGFGNEVLVKRFKVERQILAELSHTHIARLYDGGTTEEGYPYFVMELIEGQTITDFCDQKKLTVKQRIELFLNVCDAVHFANQNLIIHRDIKPSNIMVTENGEPKLLDFGIAKLIGTGKDETQGSQVMTPLFASPEQVRGEPISTASDIYALGVLLYQLLTGHSPYQLSSGGYGVLAKAICELDPPKPSESISQDWHSYHLDGSAYSIKAETLWQTRAKDADSLRKQLRGDLDHIVMKAMRKESHLRYASAQQLAEDLRRHLNGFPIIAQRGTWRYTSLKFIKRNATMVSVFSISLLLIIAFSILMTIQAHQISLERDQMMLERNNMESALNSVFAKADALDNQGFITTAEVLDLKKQVFGDQHETVAKSLYQNALLLSADHRKSEALPLFLEALRIRESLSGVDHQDVLHLRFEIASLYKELGDIALARTFYQQTLDQQRKLLGYEHENSLRTLSGLASLENEAFQFEKALTLYQETLSAYSNTKGSDSVWTASAHLNIGLTYLRQNQGLKAEQHLRAALEIYRKKLTHDNPNLGFSYYCIATLLNNRGDFAESENYAREALAILKHAQVKVGRMHYRAQAVLGRALAGQGCYQEAEHYYQRALKSLTQDPGQGHHLPNLLEHLAELYDAMGKQELADQYRAMI